MKTTKDLEIDLNDQQTLNELKAADVMPVIKQEKAARKTHKVTLEFTDYDVERLTRLSASSNWKLALKEYIDALINDKVGRPTISNPSQYSQKISGPSINARF